MASNVPEGKLILTANPHYYDDLHDIRIEGNDCKLLDGGDQSVNLVEHGQIEILCETYETKKMKFKLHDGCTFTIPFQVEEGRWLMKQEVMWKQPPETHPICIATRRYVFDVDPILAVYYKLSGDLNKENLKDLENEWKLANERIYYDHETIKSHVPLNTLSEEDQKRLKLS